MQKHQNTPIDWKSINKKLPVGRDAKGVAARAKIFSAIDMNGNGYLSLAEIDRGLLDVLNLEIIFKSKSPLMRAFQAAKNSGPQRTRYSDDYIEKNEFRLFLVYLRQYFEYWEMFQRIDVNHDKKVSLSEFKQAIPLMEKWGVKVTDAVATFRQIDENKGGYIMFDEFCHWAIKKSLDLEDDDDFEDVELAKMK